MSFSKSMTLNENLLRLALKSDQSAQYATVIFDGSTNTIVGCGYNYGCNATSNLCQCLLCP